MAKYIDEIKILFQRKQNSELWHARKFKKQYHKVYFWEQLSKCYQQKQSDIQNINKNQVPKHGHRWLHW